MTQHTSTDDPFDIHYLQQSVSLYINFNLYIRVPIINGGRGFQICIKVLRLQAGIPHFTCKRFLVFQGRHTIETCGYFLSSTCILWDTLSTIIMGLKGFKVSTWVIKLQAVIPYFRWFQCIFGISKLSFNRKLLSFHVIVVLICISLSLLLMEYGVLSNLDVFIKHAVLLFPSLFPFAVIRFSASPDNKTETET